MWPGRGSGSCNLDTICSQGDPWRHEINAEAVVVTKRGKPVAQVVPIINRPKHLWGAMRGQIEIRGDIVGPIDVEWKAMKR